jgi:hypothetical protein
MTGKNQESALGENVMSAKHRCNRHGSQKGPYLVDSLTPANGRSRPALLASASLIALAALGAPSAARARCNGANQTISTAVPGPIFAAGGSIKVLSSGAVSGSPTGVSASSCSLSKLTNQGSISGGAGGPPREAAPERQTVRRSRS